MILKAKGEAQVVAMLGNGAVWSTIRIRACLQACRQEQQECTGFSRCAVTDKLRSFNKLRKNALKRRSREGHDVQSCHKSSNMNVGFSRWGTLSIQKSLFPQPGSVVPDARHINVGF